MTGAEWEGTITVRRAGPAAADRLVEILRPEAAREVPRTRASLERAGPEGVALRLRCGDTGALRAALNTYLGWVALVERTEAALAPGSS